MIDLSTEQSHSVVSERSYVFACDEEHLYYINQDDQGYLYRINLQTGLSELLVPIFCLRVHVIEDCSFVYFLTFNSTTGASETYRIDKETLAYQPVEAYQIDPSENNLP